MTLSGTVRSIADYTQRVIISDTASPSHYPCLCCLTSRARLYVGLLRHRSRLVCTIAYLLHEFVTYVGYRPSEPARWMDDVKARDSRELNSRKPVRFKRRRRRRRAFPKSHDTYHWQADKRISRITSKTPPQSKWLLNNKKQTNKKKGRPSKEEEKTGPVSLEFGSMMNNRIAGGPNTVTACTFHYFYNLLYTATKPSKERTSEAVGRKVQPSREKNSISKFSLCGSSTCIRACILGQISLSLSLTVTISCLGPVSFRSATSSPDANENLTKIRNEWHNNEPKKRGATSWRGVGRGLILWTWISREKREHTHMYKLGLAARKTIANSYRLRFLLLSTFQNPIDESLASSRTRVVPTVCLQCWQA